MILPLKADDNGQVLDARGRVIADFWTVDVAREAACANAEAYVAMVNAKWEGV